MRYSQESYRTLAYRALLFRDGCGNSWLGPGIVPGVTICGESAALVTRALHSLKFKIEGMAAVASPLNTMNSKIQYRAGSCRLRLRLRFYTIISREVRARARISGKTGSHLAFCILSTRQNRRTVSGLCIRILNSLRFGMHLRSTALSAVLWDWRKHQYVQVNAKNK